MKLKYLFRAAGKNNFSFHKFRLYSSDAEVEIPNRIPRGPTDILKAISSTVNRDPTAAHYKYHDDPFLIPYSNFTKRSYALSQESGRKAAQWIRQQHPDLFQHKVAEPLIEAYLPRPVYNEESEVSEETLKKLIESGFVSDAILVYNLLKTKQIDLSSSTRQSLLELLCFHNEREPISEEWIEEKWFCSTNNRNDKNTWKKGGTAEQLFNELKSDSAAAYSSIISGMCKYFDVEKAHELYSEAKSNNIPLSVEAYNALLSKIYLLDSTHVKMWEHIQHLLKEMSEEKIKPNLQTLNSVLECLAKMNTHRNSSEYALSVLAEFKALNIEPSLASFLHLLEIFVKNREKLFGLFSEIMNHVSHKSYTISDAKDVYFFSRAMEISANILHNKELAYRLNDFLLFGENYNLIGDGLCESIYYRHFFFLLTSSEDLTKVMEMYDDLVPNIYIPEPAVTNAILKTVTTNMAWELLPRLWSDIVLFEQAEISGVLENVLECASQNSDQVLLDEMAKVAWSAWERVEALKIKRERSTLQWSASALGNILLILLRSGRKSEAHLVMDKLVRLGSSIMNEPKIEALSLYIDSCIEDSSPDLALKCIQYCNEIGFMETSEFARRLSNSLNLSTRQFQKLVSIVGEECLKKVEEKKESTS